MKVKVEGRVWKNLGHTIEDEVDIILLAGSIGEGLGIVGRELRDNGWEHGEIEARPFTSVRMSW